MIYLKHEVHGRKIAYIEMEAEADEKNGWVRYNEDTPDFKLAAPVNVLEVKRRRKVEPQGV